MGKRQMKLTVEKRVQFVKQYLNGERGSARTAKEAGISSTTLKRWCAIYENEGPAGLIATRKNKGYSKELKLEAVLDYLNGSDSLLRVAKRYELRSTTQLRDWIKRYNTHGDINQKVVEAT